MPPPYAKNPHKRKISHPSSDSPDFFTISKKALAGGGTALCTSVLLSLLCAFLCLLSPDPAALTLPIGLVIFFISTVTGGAVSAIGLKGRPTAATASAAFSGFILVIATGICAVWQAVAAPHASHGIPLILSIILRISAIPISALIGYFVSKKPKNHRKKHR